MYKALKSFSGLVTMAMGDVKDISDKAIAEDLLKAGYIEEVKTEKKTADNPDVKSGKPKARK